MNLVQVNNNQVVTSSRVIAETFGKRHDHVLRDIETLVKGLPKSGDTPSLFFKTFEANQQNGQSYPLYYMTRDGFSLLVMGLKGAKALEWKMKYINAFNQMEEQLKNPFVSDIPKTLPDALIAYAHALEEKDKALKQIEADKPKVALANAISVSDDDIPVGSMAKVLCQNGYQTGRSRFFAWLRENDFLIKEGKEKNQPRQEWIEKGFFKVREVPYKIGTRTQINIRTYITPKGQEYFIRRLLGGEAA